MLEKSSDDDNVGVIIFAERSGRRMSGSIGNTICHIWIRRTTERRSGGRAILRRRRRKKDAEE